MFVCMTVCVYIYIDTVIFMCVHLSIYNVYMYNCVKNVCVCACVCV